MQSYLSRRSREQRSNSGGEFCEVISTLTHDLTKARNQLVRLMNQVKPGGARLYGGYSVPHKPLRSHTPCHGSSLYNRHRTPAPGHFGCGNAYPHQERVSVQPRRPCRPMTVHGANRFAPPQQSVPFPCCRLHQKVPKSCHNKVQYSWEKPVVPYSCEGQQCKKSDTISDRSDPSDRSDRSGQGDPTCVNITFDSPEPEPELAPAAHRPQRCRRDNNTCRGSKPTCLQDSCNPARLQGGGGSSRRHNCVGTQFAALLQDVTHQLRVRRLATDLVKTP